MTRVKRFFFKFIFPFFVFIIIIITAGNLWVIKSTEDNMYSSLDKIPVNDVGLVLGTSKYWKKGKTNLFFEQRIDAAVKLYKAGKIKHLLLSGDSSAYYNEPKTMKRALIANGIPPTAITVDNFGFRTFDSAVRSKKVYQQKKITIITQNFHCYRALFISRYYGVEAIAFPADPGSRSYSLYTAGREYLARCKAIVDLYILHKQPKALGNQIDININS